MTRQPFGAKEKKKMRKGNVNWHIFMDNRSRGEGAGSTEPEVIILQTLPNMDSARESQSGDVVGLTWG